MPQLSFRLIELARQFMQREEFHNTSYYAASEINAQISVHQSDAAFELRH